MDLVLEGIAVRNVRDAFVPFQSGVNETCHIQIDIVELNLRTLTAVVCSVQVEDIISSEDVGNRMCSGTVT